MKRVLFLIIPIIFLSACASERSLQEEWITEHFPELLWSDLVFDTVNSESQNVIGLFNGYAENAINTFRSREEENSRKTRSALESFGLYDEGLDFLFGLSTSIEKKRKAAISNYSAYTNMVTTHLYEVMDSTIRMICPALVMGGPIMLDGLPENQMDALIINAEINQILGTPTQKSNVSTEEVWEEIRKIGVFSLTNALEGLQYPAVASCEFRDDTSLWIVRFDHTETRYVKFWKRVDRVGEYDVDYGTSLKPDGTPDSATRFTVSLPDDGDVKSILRDKIMARLL